MFEKAGSTHVQQSYVQMPQTPRRGFSCLAAAQKEAAQKAELLSATNQVAHARISVTLTHVSGT